MKQTPRALSELFTQYVRKQATAAEQGLGFAETLGEVLPHDAQPVQPVDPALAWKDAVVAANGAGRSWAVPPEWPQLVAAQEPAVAVALALGNFPQLVRNVQPLLTGVDLTRLRESANRPTNLPALMEWAAGVQEYPQKLLAAGVLRLAREFDRAAALLRAKDVPAEWGAARANEEAALLWHRGRYEEAAKAWQAAEATTAVLFNRGMAALFLGRAAEAHAALTQATAQLPETNAWHHLGRLYLALADARR
jgi:tetratricopeptide (TPR) repeat protein